MDKKKYLKFLSLSALILMAGVVFIALMSSFTLIFGSKKTDVTTLQRYGLTKASEKIAKGMVQPTNITIYVSDDLDAEYPELDLYRQSILRMLEKYQALSGGKISINIKNPEPYSPAEYEAKREGIRPFPDSENTKNMYFGAVFSNGDGKRFVIPYFSLQRQNYAEYDISRILAKLNGAQQKTIGVISFGGNISDWQIFNKIKADYKLAFLDKRISLIPQNINILLVFNPQQVDVNFVYALDQFIMRGGNLVLFIDSYAETIAEKYSYTKKNHNMLLPLLEKWGVKSDDQKIVADETLSRPAYQTTLSNQTNPTYLNLSAENMNIPSFLGKSWSSISFRSSGNLEIGVPQNEAKYQAIFFTSEQGNLIEADVVKYNDVETIYNALSPEHQKYNLAYWIDGMFTSSFEQSIVQNTSLAQSFPPHLSVSAKPAQIMVIADSDFIADETWNLTGYQKEAVVYDQVPANNNADFILSVIDYMSGNDEMAKLRVKYLINQDKNIAEQIYEQTFASFSEEYKHKEEEVFNLKKDLSAFQQKLRSGEIGMSLLKIQELDKYNRRQQEIMEELKALNYKIQQKSGQKVTAIILANMLFIPLGLLLLAFVFVKMYVYHRRQENVRIINE